MPKGVEELQREGVGETSASVHLPVASECAGLRFAMGSRGCGELHRAVSTPTFPLLQGSRWFMIFRSQGIKTANPTSSSGWNKEKSCG